MSMEDLGARIEDEDSDLELHLKGLNIAKHLKASTYNETVDYNEEEEEDLGAQLGNSSQSLANDGEMDLERNSNVWVSEEPNNTYSNSITEDPATITSNDSSVDENDINDDTFMTVSREISHNEDSLQNIDIPSLYTSGSEIQSTSVNKDEHKIEYETQQELNPVDNNHILEHHESPEIEPVRECENLALSGNNKINNLDPDSDESSDWDTVPAVASYDVYNDKGELELTPYLGSKPNSSSNVSLGKRGNSNKQNTFDYTKVAAEAQAQRSYQTSKKTDFLFEHTKLMKMKNSNKIGSSLSQNASTDSFTLQNSGSQIFNEEEDAYYDEYEDDIEPTDDLNRESQLNITRLLLNDMEKFAYLGAINIIVNQMCTELATLCLCIEIKSHKKLANRLQFTQKDMAAWKIATLTRLYNHLDVTEEEIQMIEKLSFHKIELSDLLKCLKTTQNINNPWETDKRNESNNNEATEETDEKKELKVDTTSMETDIMRPSADQQQITEEIVETTEPAEVINPDDIKNKNTLNIDVTWTVICDLFLLLLQNSSYDSRSRTLLMRFAAALDISDLEICEFERRVTDSLDMEQSTEDQVWDEQKHMKDRRKRTRRKKMAYIGLAMVGGSLVLGLSGGLLAPVIGAGIAAGLSTAGITGATGFLTGVGGTTVVAVSSTAIGANIGARGMNKRMGSVRTFEFKPLHNNRRVNLIISVSGWIIGHEDDVRLPFSTVDPVEGDLYSLYWEPEMLESMGQTIGIVASEVFTQTLQQVLGATILTAFMTAIQWPMALSKLGYIIDNPWNVSLDRAWSAGFILADTLMTRNLGERPVTLVGFSLGAAVIFSCLIELCKRKALGLVENVFIFGTPVVRKKEQLVMARSVVSGRFVSGYSSKDWVLAYLFRATAGGFNAIMGISPIEDIEGVENLDCTELVDGHMAYRQNMPKLLKTLGIAVINEEFLEIEENIDPEEARKHRKLIHDVGAAQKKLSSKKKQSSSWMPKWMKPKKSKWRTMVEEAVEDKDLEDVQLGDNEVPQASKPKKKDTAIVDHGALMFELQRLKAAMRKNELEQKTLDDTKTSDVTNTAVIQHSADVSTPLPHIPVAKTTNTFQLLSAGRTVLPEDDEVAKPPRDMTFDFPDDI